MPRLLTKEEYNKYFHDEDKMSVADIAQLSLVSNRLTVIDYSESDMVGGEYTPYYTQTIENGEYNVRVSLKDCGTGGYRIAAAKIEFTDEDPAVFKMALYKDQDVSALPEECFYGFDIDSGMAIVADCEVLNEYYEILEQFDESDDVISPAIEYYMTNIESELDVSYKRFPEFQIDYIDYIVPQTSHHMLFIHTGMGDGTYPVYFGYSEGENLCCAVIQFIFDI